MLTIIVNHNHNECAIALRENFAALGPTRLIDSGSTLESEQRGRFDACLPNVYYSGLLNRASDYATELDDDEPVLFICSDVQIDDAGYLVECLGSAFANPKVQVWAPSALVSSFLHMPSQATNGLRRVTFVDGFCFAARKRLFRQVCPIDLRINSLGWGLDVQFGYLAAVSRGWCVVDDRVEVNHREGAGYDTAAAMRQYRTWRKQLPPLARVFHNYSRRDRFQQGRGSRLLVFSAALMYRLSAGLIG